MKDVNLGFILLTALMFTMPLSAVAIHFMAPSKITQAPFIEQEKTKPAVKVKQENYQPTQDEISDGNPNSLF